MHRKNYGKRSGVIVDWCGAHGTWLDADELEQIAAFIAGGGLRDAATSETPGLSRGPQMNVEQFKAMVVGERLLEQEREQRERRERWTRSRYGSRSRRDCSWTCCADPCSNREQETPWVSSRSCAPS